MADCIITRRGGGGTSAGLPKFTYTGNYELIDDGNKNWRIKFLTSGTLTFTRNVGSIDVFLVGGGGSGGNRSSDTSGFGHGGGGGYTATYKNVVPVVDTPYPIIIGAGGVKVVTDETLGNDGGYTSAFGYQANGGQKGGMENKEDGQYYGDGGSGGAGDGAYDPDTATATIMYGGSDGSDGQGTYGYGSGQGSTTREFGEATGDLYSTGGDTAYVSPTSASPNTGDGGHGGRGSGSGAGGSGIVVIRSAR